MTCICIDKLEELIWYYVSTFSQYFERELAIIGLGAVLYCVFIFAHKVFIEVKKSLDETKTVSQENIQPMGEHRFSGQLPISRPHEFQSGIANESLNNRQGDTQVQLSSTTSPNQKYAVQTVYRNSQTPNQEEIGMPSSSTQLPMNQHLEFYSNGANDNINHHQRDTQVRLLWETPLIQKSAVQTVFNTQTPSQEGMGEPSFSVQHHMNQPPSNRTKENLNHPQGDAQVRLSSATSHHQKSVVKTVGRNTQTPNQEGMDVSNSSVYLPMNQLVEFRSSRANKNLNHHQGDTQVQLSSATTHNKKSAVQTVGRNTQTPNQEGTELNRKLSIPLRSESMGMTDRENNPNDSPQRNVAPVSKGKPTANQRLLPQVKPRVTRNGTVYQKKN